MYKIFIVLSLLGSPVAEINTGVVFEDFRDCKKFVDSMTWYTLRPEIGAKAECRMLI